MGDSPWGHKESDTTEPLTATNVDSHGPHWLDLSFYL